MFTATQDTFQPQGWEQITLVGAGQEVRILAGRGFNLYFWQKDGQEILMEPVDMDAAGAKYGIPLLFPTPNRMRDCRYTWQGVIRTQRKRGNDVQIHGLVLDEPWQARCWADEHAAYAEGKLSIDPQSALFEAYPFPMVLTCTYTLSASGLHLDFKVENTGDADAPFGFAIHPYFSKRGDANQVSLTQPLTRVYENSPELLPSGRILPVAGSPLDTSDGYHSVESLSLDNVYHGMTQDLCARILFPDGVRLTLRGSDVFRNLIVFTPKNRPGFCIEHQTCSTNVFELHGKGLLEEAGLLILPPAQTFDCWIDLTLDQPTVG